MTKLIGIGAAIAIAAAAGAYAFHLEYDFSSQGCCSQKFVGSSCCDVQIGSSDDLTTSTMALTGPVMSVSASTSSKSCCASTPTFSCCEDVAPSISNQAIAAIAGASSFAMR